MFIHSFLSIIIICAISSISSITSIKLFSEKRVGEGFYQLKIDRRLYFIQFKTISSGGVHVLGGIYIAYYKSKSGIWLVISRVASYLHEPKASANSHIPRRV